MIVKTQYACNLSKKIMLGLWNNSTISLFKCCVSEFISSLNMFWCSWKCTLFKEIDKLTVWNQFLAWVETLEPLHTTSIFIIVYSSLHWKSCVQVYRYYIIHYYNFIFEMLNTVPCPGVKCNNEMGDNCWGNFIAKSAVVPFSNLFPFVMVLFKVDLCFSRFSVMNIYTDIIVHACIKHRQSFK